MEVDIPFKYVYRIGSVGLHEKLDDLLTFPSTWCHRR